MMPAIRKWSASCAILLGGLYASLPAMAAVANGASHHADFLSEMRGIEVPVLPPVRTGVVPSRLHGVTKEKAKGAGAAAVGPDGTATRRGTPVAPRGSQAPRGPAGARPPEGKGDGKLAPVSADLVALRKENAQLSTQVGALRAQLTGARAPGLPAGAGQSAPIPSGAGVPLAPELDRLKTQLGQVTAERNRLQTGREALTGALSATQAQRDTLEGERRVLQRSLTALQERLALLQSQSASDTAQQVAAQGSVRTLTAKLAAVQASLTVQQARNGELEKQTAALTEVAGKGEAQEKQRVALQSQLGTLTTANADLKSRLTAAQAARVDVEARLKTLQAQWAARAKTDTALNAQLTALQTEKAQWVTATGRAEAVATSRVNDLLKTNSALRGQVATLTSAQEAAQKSAAEATAALTAAQQRALADKTQTARTQAGQLATLQAQLTEATTVNADLKAKFAAQGKDTTAEQKHTALGGAIPTSAPPPDLKTAQAQQAYASGVMMADLLRRTLALQADLGEKPDTAVLLAGVKDGVTGALRLDKRELTTLSEAVVARLSAKEKAKYDSGVKRLEALTAKKILLKRNGTLFFVQVRKGGRQLKEGESLRIALRESTLDGRVMQEGKPVQAVYSARLPYPVQQALMLGGLGGSVDVYCFASDVYPPNAVPAGLFAYTLMKYTVTTSS